MLKPQSISKTVRKVRMYERHTDFAYWQTQPYTARLETLEHIRRDYHRWKYGAEPRLQRVCAVVKR